MARGVCVSEPVMNFVFDAKNAAYPFAKVAKQLENGASDSVLSFYNAIPTLFRAAHNRN